MSGKFNILWIILSTLYYYSNNNNILHNNERNFLRLNNLKGKIPRVNEDFLIKLRTLIHRKFNNSKKKEKRNRREGKRLFRKFNAATSTRRRGEGLTLGTDSRPRIDFQESQIAGSDEGSDRLYGRRGEAGSREYAPVHLQPLRADLRRGGGARDFREQEARERGGGFLWWAELLRPLFDPT